MRRFNKLIFTMLALSLLISLSMVATATTAPMLPDDDSVTYLPNGSYTYHEGNKIYFYDIETGDTLVVAETSYPSFSTYANYHVTQDYSPYWIYFRTDGPYAITVSEAAIIRIIQAGGDNAEISLILGVTQGVAAFIRELFDGTLADETTLYRVDDGYTYYADPTYFRIESYFYADQSCRTLIDTDSFRYNG